jgi:hypothetical protein
MYRMQIIKRLNTWAVGLGVGVLGGREKLGLDLGGRENTYTNSIHAAPFGQYFVFPHKNMHFYMMSR